MFIKKDLRKIEEILVDKNDTREFMKLAKRTAEFNGSLSVICRESKLEALSNLRVLNLYDNCLTNISGIGLLANTPIEEINLGCNKLTALPLEFGTMTSLKTLWLDDNNLEAFPTCLCQLSKLEVLRLSGNSLSNIPGIISMLQCIETLALDNNDIEEFPIGVLSLPRLRNLWLRQNKLAYVPEDIDALSELRILSLSSNRITSLPQSLSKMSKLECLYANGNQISVVPEHLPVLPELREVNLANNQLIEMPELWSTEWGMLDAVTGALTLAGSATSKTKVILLGNHL